MVRKKLEETSQSRFFIRRVIKQGVAEFQEITEVAQRRAEPLPKGPRPAAAVDEQQMKLL